MDENQAPPPAPEATAEEAVQNNPAMVLTPLGESVEGRR
jgi:hypothetical protein